MPRPGPRPYECVRRAWHSERHQPMRASLVREIFRVVNEIHSSATKKNKEWQVKLPVVVFKAEEIMYSKANSEAEYMDLETLWDRTNDAINTIIRREEDTETGELLQPCIEAALILGCTARTASRSQRNSNHRCYLSPNTQVPTSVPPRVPDNVTHGGSSHLPPLHSSNPTSSPMFMSYSSTIGRPTTMRSTRLGSESCTPVTQDNNPTKPHEFPFSSESFPPPGNGPIFPMEAHPSSNLARVYPLYYGTLQQTAEPQFGFQAPQCSNSSAAALGTPHVQFSVEPTENSFLQNLFPCDESVNASNRIIQADLSGTSENPPEIECDLSLRLGTLSAPCANAGTGWHREVEDVGSSSSQEGSRSCDLSLRMDNEFCFFPRDNADDPLESCSSKWSSEAQGLNPEGPSRKRKVPVSNLLVGSEHFSQKPKFSDNFYFSRMKKPDQ